MTTANTFVAKFFSAAFVAHVIIGSAEAAFLVPNGSAPVFENWSRGAASSVYAEWDIFTQAVGGTNSPDIGQTGVLGATVLQDAPTLAIITSTGNIYSFAGPTSFDVTVPGYGLGAGQNTRVVAQIATQGSPVLPSSLTMTYDNGGSVVAPPSAVYNRGQISDGTITRNEWLAVWDIANFNPASSVIEFAASASSMSLDKLAIDSFVQTGAFAPLPNAIPEPSAIALLVSGGLGIGARRRRRRTV